jgi:hypothetical protein
MAQQATQYREIEPGDTFFFNDAGTLVECVYLNRSHWTDMVAFEVIEDTQSTVCAMPHDELLRHYVDAMYILQEAT